MTLRCILLLLVLMPLLETKREIADSEGKKVLSTVDLDQKVQDMSWAGKPPSTSGGKTVEGPISLASSTTCAENRDWSEIQILIYGIDGNDQTSIAAYVSWNTDSKSNGSPNIHSSGSREKVSTRYENPALFWTQRCIECANPKFERHPNSDRCDVKNGLLGAGKEALANFAERTGFITVVGTDFGEAFREAVGKWRNFTQKGSSKASVKMRAARREEGHFSVSIVNIDSLLGNVGLAPLPRHIRWLPCQGTAAKGSKPKAMNEEYNIHAHIVEKSHVCDHQMQDDAFPQEAPVYSPKGCTVSDHAYAVLMIYRDPGGDPAKREIIVDDSDVKTSEDLRSLENVQLKGQLPAIGKLSTCQRCPEGYSRVKNKCDGGNVLSEECDTPICQVDTQDALKGALSRFGKGTTTIADLEAGSKKVTLISDKIQVPFQHGGPSEQIKNYQTPYLKGTYTVTLYAVNIKNLSIVPSDKPDNRDRHQTHWINCNTAIDESETDFAQVVQVSTLCRGTQPVTQVPVKTDDDLTWRPATSVLLLFLAYVQIDW